MKRSSLLHHREFLRDERGGAWAIFGALLALFVVVFTWSVLSGPMENEIFGVEDLVPDKYDTIYSVLRWGWRMWPLIAMFMIVLYILMSSQTPERGTGVRRY